MNLRRVNEQTSPGLRYLWVREKKFKCKKISRQWQHACLLKKINHELNDIFI
jgi:hypothetical protein